MGIGGGEARVTASRLVTSSNRAKAEVLADLHDRLNLTLVRANTMHSH